MANLRVSRIGLLVVPIVFGLAAGAQEPAELLQMTQVTLKAEGAAECREISKRFSEAHEKGGGAFRHVWRNRLSPYEYVVVTPRENYASFDEPGAAVRGMSAGERAGLVARRRNCTESVEQTIVRPIEALSIPWSGSQPPKMVTTITSHLHAGMTNDYIEVMAELVEAMKKKGIKGYGGHRVLWGGPRTTVMTWRAHDNMAALDGEGLASRVMSEEAVADWAKRRRATQAGPSEFDIWVYEDGLSFHPSE